MNQQQNQSKPSRRGNNNGRSKSARSKPKQQQQRQSNRGRESNRSAPVAKSRTVNMGKPSYMPDANGDITISHREYVADINGGALFVRQDFAVNPGLSATFPWLSRVAYSYESYAFQKLKFIYETQSATSAKGTVILAMDYDASDDAPDTKTQAMAYRGSARSASWTDCEHNSLKEDLSKRKSYYVRSGSAPNNTDIKLYDVGNMFVCAQAQENTDPIGELYVEYVVKLMTPQLGKVGVGEAIWGNYEGSVNSDPFGDQKKGNLPADLTSTGTTTSSSTFLFTQPWSGFVSVIVIGTGIGNIGTGGGTAGVDELKEVNSGATDAIALYEINVKNAGETFVVNIANTTITTAVILFGQADNTV